MRKLKNIMISILLVCFGFVLSSCADTVYAEQEQPIKIWYQNQNGYMETYVIVDEDSGVNYIAVTAHSPRGHSVSITPRLNKDGTIYHTD